MGSMCNSCRQCHKNQSSNLESENEVSIKKYSSVPDKDYYYIENKYNYLRDIKFTDYMYSLVNFSSENTTLEDDYTKISLEYSMNDNFYDEQMYPEIFQSFIENKILKHIAIRARAAEEEKSTSIFKEIIRAGNEGLAKRLVQNDEKKNEDVEGYRAPDKSEVIKKSHIICFGVLFCFSNISKIRILYNLFKTKEGEGETVSDKLKKSEKFSDFLLSLFILASYGMANARNANSKYDEIGKIEVNVLSKYLDASQLRDTVNLVEITNKKIFGNDLNEALSYEQFKNKFVATGDENYIGYLLTPSGIRYMLEQNNV